MRKPTAVDLFAGAGGLSEGLRQAGYRVIGAVELDPHACANYCLNHPNTTLWERDVTRVSGGIIMKALNLTAGELDLLAACPPCQGFSTMRTGNGTRWNRDSRNDLIFEVLRLVRSMRPVSVMVENVPGLAANRRFGMFIKGLKALGYLVAWDVLNAADFGVPQNRRRLVLLASRLGRPAFASPRPRNRTVRQFIGKLNSPLRSRDPLHNYAPPLRSTRIEKLIRRVPRDGGSRKDLGKRSQLLCHRRFEGFNDVYGRMAWDQVAPTITGGCINPSKGRFLHPRANRAITLREAALLQTFPKTYQFDLGRGLYAVALLIGNAFPPEFIRRHAIALKTICAVDHRPQTASASRQR
jgi:DNA (cytosine-5)-methyltransferase 1